MLDYLLAIGIALSVASQLRLASFPLGPGEFCIALWIAITLLKIALDGASPDMPALRRLSLFWSLFAFALSLGACVRYYVDETVAIDDVWHDSLAYLLMAAMTCLAAATAGPHALRRIERILVGISPFVLCVHLAAGWGMLPVRGVEPWFWDRLRGLSENPNQLALFCAIVSLLALHVASTCSGAEKIWALACMAISLVVGRLTKSDTFLVAMVLAGLVFAALRVRRWLATSRARQSYRYALAVVALVFALPLCLAMTPYVRGDTSVLERFVLSFTKDKGDQATEETASLRIFLWGDAVIRGLDAGALGLGPGPHLERPGDVFRNSMPTPFEAHSTPLDTFLQGGLLALLSLAWVVAHAASNTFRGRVDALSALVCTICIFSISHFVLRHPIVWIALTLCMLVQPPNKPARLATNG